MLVQQLKERIIEGSIYCICKTTISNSLLQPFESLYFDIFSPSPTMVDPVVSSRYERMSNTLSVIAA